MQGPKQNRPGNKDIMNLSIVKAGASAYSNVIDCRAKTPCYEIPRDAARNIINVLLNTWMGPQKSKKT